VFLGYPFGTKGWKVYDQETQDIFVSRDVVFQEGIFPFDNASKNRSPINKNGQEYGPQVIFEESSKLTSLEALRDSPQDSPVQESADRGNTQTMGLGTMPYERLSSLVDEIDVEPQLLDLDVLPNSGPQ